MYGFTKNHSHRSKQKIIRQLISSTPLNCTPKAFCITLPEDSNLVVDYPGTHLGATHGWYFFLKPLPVGENTVRYVMETTLGVGNTNNADIAYSFTTR